MPTTFSVEGQPGHVPAEAVRDQLHRLLSHHLFNNSKRYPAFLRHVTEFALQNSGENLAERDLGIQVFDRDPGYDTSADPIVRVTAAEIRKRLAQYYIDPAHSGEIRIHLPVGSYVPELRLPPGGAPLTKRPKPLFWYGAASATAVLSVAAVAVLWWHPWVGPTPLDRFWAPVIAAPGSVVISMGQVAENLHLSSGDDPRLEIATRFSPSRVPLILGFHQFMQHEISLDDTAAGFRLAGVLSRKGKDCAAYGMEVTSMEDIRGRAAVFVGDSYHDWVGRILDRARFYFEARDAVILVRDRQNPAGTDFALSFKPFRRNHDYGIALRTLDPGTGQPLVLASGITDTGTAAAADFLSDPKYLRAAVAGAPRNWDRMNIEFVLKTEVVNNVRGVPVPVAAHYWKP